MSHKISMVSSDSFMINMVQVLLELCKPFLIVGDDKLKKLDPTYLISGKRLDIGDETSICTDKVIHQIKILEFREYRITSIC
jgi:hypothetical protein